MRKMPLAAVAAVAFATVARADDPYAPMYGNTLQITGPDGGKNFVYINRDMTWEEHLADGTVLTGTYFWKNAKTACFKTLQPPSKRGAPLLCIEPEPGHKIGDVWTYKADDGRVSILTLSAGRLAAPRHIQRGR